MNKKHNFKQAFTLAEIVIALSIIGVIAALTLPNVLLNTNAAQAKVAFKKAINSLDQAVLTNSSEQGYDFSETLSVAPDGQSIDAIIVNKLGGKRLTGNAAGETEHRWKIYANFIATPANVSTTDTASAPTLNAAGEVVIANAVGDGYKFYQTPDGMTFILPPNLISCGQPRLLNSGGVPTTFAANANTACIGFVDINGTKGPNQVVGCDAKPDDIADEAAEYVITTPGDAKICQVKDKSITDVFPIVFFNDKAYPATYSAMTVYMDAQEDD